jgi:ferredoxin
MAKVPWVDKDQCIGCGLCVYYVPGVFRLDAEGRAECCNPDGAGEEEIRKNAMRMCPVQCIHWRELVENS